MFQSHYFSSSNCKTEVNLVQYVHVLLLSSHLHVLKTYALQKVLFASVQVHFAFVALAKERYAHCTYMERKN
jgi:hypothetical protein